MKMLFLNEVAQKVGMSVSALRRRCERGQIARAVKMQTPNASGYAWAIPEDALDDIQPMAMGKRSPNYPLKNGGSQ